MNLCPECNGESVIYYSYDAINCVLNLERRCDDCGHIFDEEHIENYIMRDYRVFIEKTLGERLKWE